MHMWSVFPWPGRTMGASFALLGWANPSLPPAALGFRQWLGMVSVAVERRHHRMFLLGRRWVILGCTLVMQMLQNTMATYHRGQAGTFLPHAVPRPLQRKGQDGGGCNTWNLCSSTHTTLSWISLLFSLKFLNFSPPISQINSKDKGQTACAGRFWSSVMVMWRVVHLPSNDWLLEILIV